MTSSQAKLSYLSTTTEHYAIFSVNIFPIGGGAVTEVTDRGEALELCCQTHDQNHCYDMLVVENRMAAMDGFEFVEQVRQLGNIPDMVAIMTSLSGARGDTKKCQTVGIDAYLSWPFTYKDLYKTVAHVIKLEDIKSIRAAGELVTKHSISKQQSRAFNILLVEDYPTNQKVATTHLKSLGCSVTLAENGEQAVKNYLENNFDLIFMDVQMPIMDGLTATRTIREDERSSARTHVPIVAMTANAMKGDREECIEAGMDDYISKPVKLVGIADMIDRWLTPEKDIRHPSSAPDCVDPLTEPLQALPFEMDRVIQEFEGQRDVVIEIIDEFLLDVRKQLETITHAIDEGETEIIRREAHSIKGGARNITAEPMADAAATLEDSSKSGELENAGLVLKKLEEEINRFELYYRQSVLAQDRHEVNEKIDLH